MLNEKKELKEIKPSAARLIESLRDTGYTFTTAVADIVDNSVAAEATSVEIRLELEFGGSTILMIADNGHGMTEEGLEAAMMYGSPLRPSPKSLGKFGMGLKTASTSFCRKLTVISKKSSVYSLRQWDLDEVAKLDRWVLLEPEQVDYDEQISFLEEVTGGGSGTLVIWENIDRLVRTNTEGTAKTQIDKIAEELEYHLSGVFYNFLEPSNGHPNLIIKINGRQIESWDPFCRWLNADGDARVEIHKNKPFNFTRETNGTSESIGTFFVNVYILPNRIDLTEEEQKRMRYGLDNQGFHVFREGRMISSGGWPNRLFVKEPHLNLIRVELLFDHTLDDYFQIDIKKSRIDLPKEIRDLLKKVITPARNEANKRYRTGNRNGKKGSLIDQHGKSSNAIKKHHDTATAGSMINSLDKDSGEAEVKNKFGTTKVKLQFDDNVDRLVQPTINLQDGVLWMPGLADGNKHAVFINESHEFYKKFYFANKDNSALVLAMDALLWSLAEAELSVLSDSVRRNVEDFRISVSRSLRSLAEELPEVDEIDRDSEE
ncbi:ATP-binding protein [Litoribacter ruber]|uniref:ATP-binding protein n=1 Tax=Litoribacter ruber TaxID=702568 RepID=UPI001BDAA57C|nr:ATP-binding protein [Litoribacter ruber]MBT0812971.1 ATP-binding protein [Litoribacter ruber]